MAPSVSRKQRKFMGLVHAVQEGEVPPSAVRAGAKKAAQTMKPSDVREFAETKEKGLPTKKPKKITVRHSPPQKINKEGNIYAHIAKM